MAKQLVFVAVASAAMIMGAQQASAVVSADILWVVDTSGSMGGDIAQIKTRIGDFNTAMTNAGIDAHYGLVEFGGNSGNGSTSGTGVLFQDIVDFSTFNMAGNPFSLLSASGGGNESGSLATDIGLNGATFRNGAVINVILVTDEDDDSSLAQFNAVEATLTAKNALFNFIGRPGVGNTNARYGVLAANHGGAAFDIIAFRNDPDPFFVNFVNTKVQEIIDQGRAVPEPVTAVLGLLSLGALAGATSRRRIA